MSHVFFFFYQLHVPSIRWSCDSIPKHGVYRSGWTMVMSRDVFLQDFARLLNGYFYASHQMNQKKGTSLYSIMSTFRTHSIEIQNLRTFHFKWDFHPPPKKNIKQTLQTPTEHIQNRRVFCISRSSLPRRRLGCLRVPPWSWKPSMPMWGPFFVHVTCDFFGWLRPRGCGLP